MDFFAELATRARAAWSCVASPAQRRGTIASYFHDNVDDEKIHQGPPPISPG